MPRIGGPSSASSSATPTPTKPTYHVPFFGPPALKNPIRMQRTYEYDDQGEDEETEESERGNNRKGKAKKSKKTMSPAIHNRLENIAEILNYWNRGYLEDFMKGLAYRGEKGLSPKKLAKAIVGHLERRAKRGCRLIQEEEFAKQLDRMFMGRYWRER
ncbi:hypothetical protein FRC00_004417 [Tulasnella sp. 408]|nr:hypothetical protein FRC00_004417 [Tulasnella sp. 408]